VPPPTPPPSGPGPCIYALTGYPGTGKYTIAKELVAQLVDLGMPVRLMDNHETGNAILRLIEIEPGTPMPEEVWARVREVRDVIFRTIETMSPPDWSFVFTNFVLDTPPDREHYRRLAELATLRRSRFVPVRVSVDLDELLRRVSRPERAARLKLTDVDFAREIHRTKPLYRPPADDGLDLDVTHLEPAAAARRILAHAAAPSAPSDPS
jgi:hypothetical protein